MSTDGSRSADIAPPRRGAASWCADRHIATKVLASVAVLALAALVVGVFGLHGLAQTDGATASMYSQNVKESVATTRLVGDVKDMRIAIRDAALAPTPADAQTALDSLGPLTTTFNSDVRAFKATSPAASTAKLLERVRSDVAAGLAFNTANTAPLALKHDTAGWVAANAKNQSFKDATANLETLSGLVASDARRTAAENHTSYEHLRVTMLLVLLVGIALGAVAAVVVARDLAKRVGKVQKVAEALAAGDLTATSGIRSRDEIGQMSTSLDDALTQLRELMTSSVETSEALAAAAEELSASSQQIAAGAEETSVQ
ncbi:methyl-accepting chemotaxis protein, partial [Nocardioides mangrovicus]